jgi:hypothetical protein
MVTKTDTVAHASHILVGLDVARHCRYLAVLDGRTPPQDQIDNLWRQISDDQDVTGQVLQVWWCEYFVQIASATPASEWLFSPKDRTTVKVHWEKRAFWGASTK